MHRKGESLPSWSTVPNPAAGGRVAKVDGMMTSDHTDCLTTRAVDFSLYLCNVLGSPLLWQSGFRSESFLWDSWMCEGVGLWFLFLILDSFPYVSFVQFCFILLYYIFLLLHGRLFAFQWETEWMWIQMGGEVWGNWEEEKEGKL